MNLVTTLTALTSMLYVISGGEALDDLDSRSNLRVIRLNHRVSFNPVLRVFNYASTQFYILVRALNIPSNVDVFVFFIGGEGLVIPIMILRMLRKKIVLMPAGVAAKAYRARGDGLAVPLSRLLLLNSAIANTIIIYSESMVTELGLDRYRSKLKFASEHIVDMTRFFPTQELSSKTDIIGYVGRLSEEKGIRNLVAAIPLILKRRCETVFVICGDGEERGELERKLADSGLRGSNGIRLVGWIRPEKIPEYLNDFRLIIIPSYTEGLPNILLEAMACGTPVLATPVGAIPVVIQPGKTGFLLPSNSPGDIAHSVIELLDKPEDLEYVSANALDFVRANYSRQHAIETWDNIFESLSVD